MRTTVAIVLLGFLFGCGPKTDVETPAPTPSATAAAKPLRDYTLAELDQLRNEQNTLVTELDQQSEQIAVLKEKLEDAKAEAQRPAVPGVPAMEPGSRRVYRETYYDERAADGQMQTVRRFLYCIETRDGIYRIYLHLGEDVDPATVAEFCDRASRPRFLVPVPPVEP